ncbi:hypothetical protein C1T30_43940, partial [Bacillus sp. MBGLi97]
DEGKTGEGPVEDLRLDLAALAVMGVEPPCQGQCFVPSWSSAPPPRATAMPRGRCRRSNATAAWP